MEIRCQIIFIKHRFWKIHELETFGTRKRILRTNLEGCRCDRKRSVVFWTFHTFPRIFSRELFLAAAHGWFAIQTNVWKVQNTTGHFLLQLYPSNFLLKILFLVPNVSNSWILQKRFFKKIIWHRISIQTLLFQACLPTRQNGVENRDKAYCEYRLSKDCFRWSQRKKSLVDIWKPSFLFLFQNSFDTSQRKYSKR